MNMQRNIELSAPWLTYLNQLPALFTPARSPLAQAWQSFRNSLPVEIPKLGEAASAYTVIKIALSQLQAQLERQVPVQQIRLKRRAPGAKSWMRSAHLRA